MGPKHTISSDPDEPLKQGNITLYTPAGAGSFQSALCPPRHNPHQQLVSVISRQALKINSKLVRV